MNKLTLALAAIGFSATTQAIADTTIFFEDFEDANVSYTTSTPEFTDGGGDFFIRTDGSNISSSVDYDNIQGTSFFAAMDINGDGEAPIQTLTFADIDIAGYSNLTFSGLFAEDDDGTKQDWDATDFVKIEFNIDDAGWNNLLAFENDGSQYNSEASVDSDFDGNGDGAVLTDEFSLFSAAILGTGAFLDLRITIALEAGDEDIAFDNLSVSGTSPVPLPAAAWLLLSGIGALGFMRRRG